MPNSNEVKTGPGEYLVLSRGQWDASASRQEIQRAIDAFYLWHDRMVADGKMKVGSRLTRNGKFVSRAAVTDGPYSESKEIVGGYWFVLADSLEGAARLLADSPCLAHGLFYEVRQLDPRHCSAFMLTAETPGDA